MLEILLSDPWKITTITITLCSIVLNLYQWRISRRQNAPREYKSEIRNALIDILSAKHQTTIFEKNIAIEYFGYGISSLEQVRKNVSRAIAVINSAPEDYANLALKFEVRELSKKLTEVIGVRDSYEHFRNQRQKEGKAISSVEDEADWPDRSGAIIKLHILQEHLRKMEESMAYAIKQLH